jgi:hypothetical protein
LRFQCVAFPARVIQLGCRGEKGDARTRVWLSTLPFEALADVSSSTRGSHVPSPLLFEDVTRKGKCCRRTCTGRRSFAAAMTFWASVVIHSTWRCHSGGVVDVVLGGGASSALRKEEYVTSMDFRMYRSAGRRSVGECVDSERIGKMLESSYLPRRPVGTVGVRQPLQGRESSP